MESSSTNSEKPKLGTLPAGYSHDWNTIMHPVRVEVRQYLDSILCESSVRTIDRILCAHNNKLPQEKLREMVEDEYRLGHILSFHLLENLPAYEAGNKTLQEYYPELIKNINVEFGTSRWMDYWSNAGKKQF